MPNRLIHETSPYLLQHAHNPVHWYPWGAEALDKAKQEQKLLLISIGYSACHWCHVMEKESFENEHIAQIMNAHFVCIKVDREERSDIDQIYMEAVQMMTGQGGWPLNCFALPDGRPVYGGTYFHPQQWENLLLALSKGYKETPEKFLEFAKKLTEGLQTSSLLENTSKENDWEETLQLTVENFTKRFDIESGGFKGAPKFPMPSALNFLIETAYFTQDANITDFLKLTLSAMANGGLYDQIGGGFARYSVDAQWKVPHFEKMLYDNAQLISVYSKAYMMDKNPRYKEVIEESLAYIDREMTNESGGFYSAQDADSEGIEGKFYVWNQSEVESDLGKDAPLFLAYYQMSKEGNWEHGNNILYPIQDNSKLLNAFNLTETELNSSIGNLKKKLFSIRTKRAYPNLDDKSITAWNALMLMAYIDAYKALGKPAYLEKAIATAQFIQNLIDQKGELKRIFKNSQTKIEGFLDDYAFSIEAFIALYQITFVQKYLDIAILLNGFVEKHFYDKKTKLYYYTSIQAQKLIARKMEISDQVIPSSNSVMAHNLYSLGILLSESTYLERSKQMLMQVQPLILKGREYYANWARLIYRFVHSSIEVVIMGEKYIRFTQQLQNNYHPLAYYLGSKTNAYLPLMENRQVFNDTKIYVCKNKSCLLPTSNLEEGLKMIAAI